MRSTEADSMYPGGNKCGEMFHPEIKVPFCLLDGGHEEELHRGFDFSWETEPQVDVETAELFLGAYRKIPNGTREIKLNDDGSVTIGLRALNSTLNFIGVARNPRN